VAAPVDAEELRLDRETEAEGAQAKRSCEPRIFSPAAAWPLMAMSRYSRRKRVSLVTVPSPR
jgi:hypothetical protein